MKVILLGGTGMLGSDVKEVLARQHQVLAPNRGELDIISWDVVIENFQDYSPDVVVNCAGFTDVDACEKESFLVRKINVEGPRNLAQGSARFECKLVHISSDYVYDGQKMMPQPYFEDDSLNPLSAYGKSKLDSEIAVRENAPSYIIIRTGWLYGMKGKNFIRSIIQQALEKKKDAMRVADDQFGAPTWTYRVAEQIEKLLESDGRGTYHATAEGYCSRFECAEFVLDKLSLKANLEPCSMNDFEGAAKRPANCYLENRLLKKQGINEMRYWKEDLEIFLEQFGDDLIKEIEGQKP